METFSNIIDNYNWDRELNSIYSKKEADVLNALKNERRNLEDFKALISPAAKPFLEQMAGISNRLTLKRFGKTVQLFIPLYLSNYCENQCVYCGFNSRNRINRSVLSDEQIMKEVEILKSYGYEHLLLVTGEAPKRAGMDYFKHVFKLIKPYFSQISIEVQPLDHQDYEELITLGLNSVFVYQETYHKEKYQDYHLSGKKADFFYRLDTPDRLGMANIHKTGLGILIGLEDWRTDSFFTALHLSYLKKKYWQTKFSISFPRLRPHMGAFEPNVSMDDKELVQLICAYRLFDENLELSISVRENKEFRDNIFKLGITNMSAGSKTNPGGYASDSEALEQFEVHDGRTPAEIEKMIRESGYEAVWKDWDKFMQI